MLRRDFVYSLIAGSTLAQFAQSHPQRPRAAGEVFLERPVAGQPHKGKVLLAIQAHSDDIPLSSSGTVAKLIEEGYTGYLVRATNDDMGDAPGLGTPGTIGENVLGPGLTALASHHACVGEVRGLGVFWALDLVRDKATREPIAPYGGTSAAMADLVRACKERGLLPFTNFNRLHAVPPCNVTEAEAREGIEILDEALSTADAYCG